MIPQINPMRSRVRRIFMNQENTRNSTCPMIPSTRSVSRPQFTRGLLESFMMPDLSLWVYSLYYNPKF